MNNQVYEVFEAIEFKAKLLAQYWHNFHIEICQHLPETYLPEIEKLSQNLETALNQHTRYKAKIRSYQYTTC